MRTRSDVPQQLGRYHLLRMLGEGGMGAVYLAEDTLLGRCVALKVLLLDSPEHIERFRREARAAAAIDHANVCPVLDVGDCDDIHYLTMPYIEGLPLTHLTDLEHLLPPAQAVALVCKLARALETLHERGLIHRDLKPANVLLKPGCEPVLMDFGLARSFGDAGPRLTRTGQAVGTPAYMSPEQVNGDKTIGPATDIYSLGVILYELLTGQRPFEAWSVAELYGQIILASRPAPSAARPGLPPELDAICVQALAKKPADRFASMAEFAAALQRFLESSPAGPVAGPSRTGPTRPSAASGKPMPLDASSLLTDDTREPPAAETLTVKCPACRRKLKMPAAAWGKRGRCPVCKHSFRVPADLDTLVPTSAAGPPPQAGDTEKRAPASQTLLPAPDTQSAPASGASGVRPPPPGRERGLPPRRAHERTNALGLRLVLIPAGSFTMGSPPDEADRRDDEEPHGVEITRPFWLGICAVTQQDYERVMGANPSWFAARGGGRDKVAGLDVKPFPVETVSWKNAVEFCRRLSELPEEKQAGCVYHLPTEAQWEYACRGPAALGSPFAGGRTLAAGHANFGNHLGRTTPVGSYPPNAWGLYDLHGNIWEWCADWYDKDYYRHSPRRDPSGPQQSGERVLRGGSWDDVAALCRSACRNWHVPGYRANYIGFRVACAAGSEAS